MNLWATRSARLAQRANYLDRLHEIYPSEGRPRIVPDPALRQITRAYRQRNCRALLKTLLDQQRFPFDDSYVSFLREDRSAIRRNPETVQRICRTLYGMGLRKVLRGVKAPVVANRRRGAQFKQWAKSRFRHVGVGEFEASISGIVFLKGSEKLLRDYANEKFGAGLRKRPDFVAKTRRRYVVGEAKFLSSEGGEQRGGFEDAVTLAAHPAGGATKVSILDGIVWLQKGSGFYQYIDTSSNTVFSALLLKEFLESVGRRG